MHREAYHRAGHTDFGPGSTRSDFRPIDKEMGSSNRSMTEDVELYTSPWVSGTRAAAYFGPIEGWTKAERELLESLRDKARGLGANAVVGPEVTLDPFGKSEEGATGLRLHAVGTAAKLEPLF
jgi:hypothetical protein